MAQMIDGEVYQMILPQIGVLLSDNGRLLEDCARRLIDAIPFIFPSQRSHMLVYAADDDGTPYELNMTTGKYTPLRDIDKNSWFLHKAVWLPVLRPFHCRDDYHDLPDGYQTSIGSIWYRDKYLTPAQALNIAPARGVNLKLMDTHADADKRLPIVKHGDVFYCETPLIFGLSLGALKDSLLVDVDL